MPEEFERLRTAAAPHLRPLLTWLVGTGCRLGETLALDWREVDLAGAQARLWADTTKAGRSRVVSLPPAVVAALATLPARVGPVFLTPRGQPYRGSGDGYGGQVKKAWASACKAAGVTATPHELRHTFASWHWAIHRDLLRLREAGGWASVAQVERYAHLMPAGHEAGIRRVWGVVKQRRVA